MTLPAPTRLRRLRGFPSANASRIEPAGSTAPEGTLPAAPTGPGEVVLTVDFTSPDGRTWWAVGVSDNLADAIAFAQDSCPTDTTWRPVEWNDLYGDQRNLLRRRRGAAHSQPGTAGPLRQS